MNVFVLEPHPVTRRAICALIDRTPDLELQGAAGNLTEAHSTLAGRPIGLVIVEPLAASGREAELLATLARMAPGAKLFVLSARAEKGFVERILAAGASGFVYKGESAETTVVAIHDVIEGRRVVLGVFTNDVGSRRDRQFA